MDAPRPLPFCEWLWFFVRQALVDGLDKIIRGPRPRCRPELWFPRLRRSCGFDLLERFFLADHVLDRVADDHDHVAVIHYVDLTVNPATPRQNLRSSWQH